MAMNVSIVLKLLDGVTGPIKKLTAAIQDANKSIETTKKKADKAFDQAKNIKIAGDGVKNFADNVNASVKDITDPFKQFEQAMTRVRAVSNGSSEDFANMAKVAREVGSSGRASATEAAQALEQLNQSGLRATESMAALPTMLDRARISQTTLKEAIDSSIDTTKAFGLSLSTDVIAHVNDVTTAVAKASGTSFVDMSRALETSGVAAKAAGVSFERTATFIGLLSKAGIQGEKAGDALRAMFGKLVNPEMVANLNAVGVKTNEMVNGMQQARDPLEVITDLQKAMTKAGFNNARQLGILGKVVGDEAAPRIQALLKASQGAGLDQLKSALDDVTGAAGAMAKAMEGPEDATRKLQGTTGELLNVIAESMLPTLRDLEQRTIKTRIALTGWLKEHPVLTKAIGLFAVTLGVAATALSGLFAVTSAMVAAKGFTMLATAMGVKMPLAIIKGLIPALLSGATSLGAFAASLGSTLVAVAVAAAPFVAAAAGVAILVAALGQLVRLVEQWDELDFGESLRGLKETFGDGTIWDGIGNVLKTATFNPFEGLTSGVDALKVPQPMAMPAPLAINGSAVASGGEAPNGMVTVKVEQNGSVSVKKPLANTGIDLELGAGVLMSH